MPTANVISQPKITSILPTRGVVGSTNSVTINGSGFRSGATVSAGSGITVNVVSVTNSQIVADFIIAATATGGNRNVTVSVGGMASNPKTFFIQTPSSVSVLSSQVYAAGPLMTNGCPLRRPYGFQASIAYQVLDQEGQAINATLPLREDLRDFRLNGQPTGFPDRENLSVTFSGTTEANGTFVDEPVGTCAERSFTTGSFTQDLFIPLSETVKPVIRFNQWTNAGLYNCGNITNGVDISVSKPCQ